MLSFMFVLCEVDYTPKILRDVTLNTNGNVKKKKINKSLYLIEKQKGNKHFDWCLRTSTYFATNETHNPPPLFIFIFVREKKYVKRLRGT